MAKRRGKTSHDEINRQIGLRLKTLRLARGYTQEDVGGKIGLTYQQVQKYEKGATSLSCGRVPEICAIYGIDPNGLFTNVIPSDFDAGMVKQVIAMSSWALQTALEMERFDKEEREAVDTFFKAIKRKS